MLLRWLDSRESDMHEHAGSLTTFGKTQGASHGKADNQGAGGESAGKESGTEGCRETCSNEEGSSAKGGRVSL